MLLIVFDSKTGNVQRFVDKLNMRAIKIIPDLIIDEPFILITYTTGFGEVPKITKEFLNRNYLNLRGVASSGNRNWGSRFALAADKISYTYSVPIILKFELSGTKNDVEKFMQEVAKVVCTNSKMDSAK